MLRWEGTLVRLGWWVIEGTILSIGFGDAAGDSASPSQRPQAAIRLAVLPGQWEAGAPREADRLRSGPVIFPGPQP